MKTPQRIYKIFLFFIILSISFFQTNSIIIELEPNGLNNFKIDNKTQFTLKIPNNNHKYLEFTVNGNNRNINYVVSVYSDSNINKRIQLGESIFGETKLYLSLNQFTNDIIYFEIECPLYFCEGKITNIFSQTINLKESQPFSYYVNEKNTEMEFVLELESSISNIWARGQFDISTELDISNKIQSKEGNFYIVSGLKNGVKLKVIGTPGDYINVGYVSYNQTHESISKMRIVSAPLTAFLKKGILNNICYIVNDDTSNEAIFGTGIIFTKIAYFYSLASDGEIFSSGIIRNIIRNPNENSKVCFKFPDPNIYPQFSNIEEIIFTYQLTEVKTNNLFFRDPQLNGIFYPSIIKSNSKAAFISQKNGDFTYMSLNVMQVKGYTKMYVVQCNNFPLCSIDQNVLKEGIRPRNINRFSSYRASKGNELDESPISRKQTILVVECDQSDTLSEETPFCTFNTLIYKEKKDNIDTIQLFEEHFFNQFALNEQKHNYKIKISKETKIKKVFIDIMSYVGDVEVNTNFPSTVRADQYVAINKIFISAKITENLEPEDLIFTVTAKNNTYYTILVNFGREEIEEDSFITNKIQTGMVYLVTIDPTNKDTFSFGNKIVKFKNEQISNKLPFMVNFYSLNCEVEIKQIIRDENLPDEIIDFKPISQYENFAYDLIVQSESIYNSPSYDYGIKIIEADNSDYYGKLCKLYTSAIELSPFHKEFMRDILIPDNTPQQALFRGNNIHVSYGYIHVDHSNNDLLIKFNPKNIAHYQVKLYYEYEERENGPFSIVANDMLYIENSEWKKRCRDPNRVCYIQIDICLLQLKEGDNAVLEFSVKSMASHSVDYIQKNNLKIDYVQNDIPQYYYTEIGRNENGFIIANFLRGSGKILAKIVETDLKVSEEGANWRGKYRLPSDDDALTMKLDPFTKKINYSTQNECRNGCFLLICVFSDVKGDKRISNRNFPYSIIVHSYPNEISNLNIPFINIPTDEYIVGSIIPSKQINKIYEFYSVRLNKNAEQVIVDFQSDAAGLFVNIGKNRINSINDANFKFFPMGKDTLHRINIHEIQSIDESIRSLKDIYLTLGIWTNVTDSINTTLFSFAVRLGDGVSYDIYRVNSDQKVLCDSLFYGDRKFRCVYVMEYDYIQDFSGLFIYANIQDKSTLFNIYAKFIDSKVYEIDSLRLKDIIPSEDNYTLSSKEQNTEFLYVEDGFSIEEYILVTVETNKPATIELLSTIFLYPTEITPNPSSPQLFMNKNNYLFSLNFPKDYSVMVNLVCIGGSAELFWDFDTENKYYLKGRDDRLSITSDVSGKDQKLLIKSTSEIKDGIGFVFYTGYNIRQDKYNFDELNLDKSINYVYINSDFPISFYTQLKENIGSDEFYDVFFTFDNLEPEDKKALTFYDDSYPFTFTGIIVKQSDIYKQRKNPYAIVVSFNPNKIEGHYDQAMRTALIRISSQDIDKAEIPKNEKTYLFIKIDKADSFRSIRKYKRIGVESTVLSSKSQVPISELSNQFGYLDISELERQYILRIDKTKQYMNLEFSCEDNKLIIEIKNKKNLIKEKTLYGKDYYSLLVDKDGEDTIILSIIRNEDQQDSNKKEFFMFRYTFSDDKYNNKYTIKNTKLEVTKKETKLGLFDYFIKLTPLNDYNNYNLTYIIRGNYEGDQPKTADLSMKVNSQKVKEYYDPQPNGNTLTFEMYNITKNFSYIQVILQIRKEENVEYLSYDLENNFKFEKYDTGKKKSSNKGIIIAAAVLGPIIFVVVIILILTLFIYNNKNKDLMEKVSKISFAEDQPKVDDDKFLILNNDENNNN